MIFENQSHGEQCQSVATVAQAAVEKYPHRIMANILK